MGEGEAVEEEAEGVAEHPPLFHQGTGLVPMLSNTRAVYIVTISYLLIYSLRRCGNVNFARRDECNRCKTPRPYDPNGDNRYGLD